MRCKKCAKTFRTPPHKMRKTQICSICTKKLEQRKTEKITHSVKWNVVKSKTINEHEVKSDSMKNEPESETMQDLKNQQIKNQSKLIQIIDEIFVLNKEREILLESIKLGKKQLDGYKEKKFLNRLIKFSMKKKKMVDHTKRFLSEKDSELEKNYLELNKKRSEQNICRIKIEEIIEKIIQIDKNLKDEKIQNKATLIITNETEKNELKAPRIKEPLIEEAERIKIELEELKKQKKVIDLSKNKNKKQSGNEIRLNITLSDIERFVNIKNMSNTQPYISVLQKFVNLANQFPDESLTKIFQSRFRLGIRSANTVKNQRSIVQNFENFLKPQHTKMSQIVTKQIINSSESTNKKQNIDEINQLISEALIIIRKNSSGVHKKILEQKLMMTEEEFEKFLPKLLRIEDIVEEDDGHSNVFLKSIENNDERVIQEQSTDVEKIRNEIKELKKRASERIEKEKIEREHAPEIEKITMKMIQNHLHWKRNISKELKRKVISEFVEFRSLTKIYDLHPNDTAERIRSHIITDLRLPSELKKLENEGAMHPNLVCSLAIALYATDYFHWDGKKQDEGKIIDLAKSISKYLKSDKYINQLFQGKKIHNN